MSAVPAEPATAAVVAAVLAAVAAWCLVPGPASTRLRRRLGPALVAPATPERASGRGWRRLGVPLTAGLLVVLVLRLSAGRPHLVVLGLTGLAVAWAVSRLLQRGRARRLRLARRGAVVAMCDALVAELQSGQPPASAVATVATEWPELAMVRDAARLGGDVPQALRHLSSRPGGEPLAQVAAGWEVAARSGAGLAQVLDRLARVLRTDDDVRREVHAGLAAPRATATMLAVLPVFGIGLGTAIGADPVSVLLGSLAGACCLAAGVALAVGGLFWVERIVDRAEV
jgi:tight adherence protein B